MDIEEIEVRNESLEEIWCTYDTAQTKLEELAYEKHSQHRESIEEQYISIKATIRKILNKHSNKIEKKTEVSANTTIEPEASRLKINLPALKIPQFDGKYDQWRNFYDIFTAVIDQNQALTDIEKLFYLRQI